MHVFVVTSIYLVRGENITVCRVDIHRHCDMVMGEAIQDDSSLPIHSSVLAMHCSLCAWVCILCLRVRPFYFLKSWIFLSCLFELLSIRNSGFGIIPTLPAIIMAAQPEELVINLSSRLLSLVSPPRDHPNHNISIQGLPPKDALNTKELTIRPQSLTGQGKKCVDDLCDNLWNCILDYV